MKTVCSKHGQAHEMLEGCNYCVGSDHEGDEGLEVIYISDLSSVPRDFTGLAIDSADSKFYFRCGLLHRDGAPAVIYRNGTIEYYQDDKLHNVWGPSIIYATGAKLYYLSNKCYAEDVWEGIALNMR